MMKVIKWITLVCWGAVLAGNIVLWANGNPPEMDWFEIFLHEGAIVSMCLGEIVREHNLF